MKISNEYEYACLNNSNDNLLVVKVGKSSKIKEIEKKVSFILAKQYNGQLYKIL